MIFVYLVFGGHHLTVRAVIDLDVRHHMGRTGFCADQLTVPDDIHAGIEITFDGCFERADEIIDAGRFDIRDHLVDYGACFLIGTCVHGKELDGDGAVHKRCFA